MMLCAAFIYLFTVLENTKSFAGSLLTLFSRRCFLLLQLANSYLYLTHIHAVMVCFMSKLEWFRGAQVKHYFLLGLWRCFQMRLAFESVDWMKIDLTSVGENHPICRGQNGAKKQRNDEHSLLGPEQPSFPATRHRSSWSSGPLDSDWDFHHGPSCSGLQSLTGTTPLALLGL